MNTIPNFRQVTDSLSTSGQPTEADLKTIAEAGFEVVINLALHDDPKYSLADEPGTVRALGMDYVHIPVLFNAPTRHDFELFVAALAAHQQRKIWIHCAANIRVTAFLGLHRVLNENWNTATAFELMNSVWKPNKVWAAFIEKMLSGLDD